MRSPAKTTRRGLGDIVHAAPARRECVVYPDGNSDAVEPAPPTPPKEREKRDSLLCDGDTVDAVLGSVFD